MKLSELPWGTIGKVAGAAIIASGLFGTGYFTGTPTKEPTSTKATTQSIVIEIPLKVIIDGQEATKKAKVKQ